ncbi:hypothetical protein MMC27_000249, partial [Xylographa pallens]|nr:hypothetical protein [Xylographa pallens]
EVVLDILKPVFRKDEESAWTIVNSRAPYSASTRARTPAWRPGSSICIGSKNSVAMQDDQPSSNKRFDFENDLILGPVYKRILFAQLCVIPTISEARSQDLEPQSSSNQGKQNVPDEGSNRPETESESTVGVSSIDREDWSPENIVKILRACGGFSIGVGTDLEKLRRTEVGSRLPKRSLPLGAILMQNQLIPAGQAFVNAKLILGATMDDADQVAQALDEGAEINAISGEGCTALQISLGGSQTSITAALILLYNETKVHLRDNIGDTLLHYAIKSGSLPLIRRLVTSMDDLRVFDGDGATPLHVAAQGGVNGLISLREINSIFAGQEVFPDMIVDHQGRTALHIGAQGGHPEHVLELLRLGCDPSLIPKPTSRPLEAQVLSSPLYLAVAAGHVDLVREILEECSNMLTLVNWKHHIQHTLLDCVKHSHLKQRYAMAELLILRGADWRQTWKQSDRLLEFSNTGTTPRLLLTLIIQGCFPTQRDLDISPSLDSLQDQSNRDLAAAALSALQFNKSVKVGGQPRLSFYARMGYGTTGGRSAFTERITLEDILQMGSGKARQQTKDDDDALTPDEHATDALIPVQIAFQADASALGQAYYHMDRFNLDDATKGTRKARAKQYILNIFGLNEAP